MIDLYFSWKRLTISSITAMLCALLCTKCSEGAPPVGMFWLFSLALGIGLCMGTIYMFAAYHTKMMNTIKDLKDTK
jgi:hypothetical protein